MKDRPAAPTDRPTGKARLIAVARETITGTMGDGPIYAGNVAYLSIVTLLPLIILITAATAVFGRTDAGYAVIAGLLDSLPAQAEQVLRPAIQEVLTLRTGNLLWMGGLVALWTVTRFVETIRNIFYHAYAQELGRPAWVYRLFSVGATALAMVLLLIAFISQLVLQVVLDFALDLLPYSVEIPAWIDISRLVPPVLIFLALWAIFKLLAPVGFRRSPSWPGALLTAFVWVAAAMLMGPILAAFGGMSATYGALSGVMATMLFFYIVGMALFMGAQLNAALANSDRPT